MAVALYMDVHVPWPITDQLRRRGVDVLTAIEDAFDRRPDDEVLDRARALNRVVFTQDIRFNTMAEAWQRERRPFAGLVFGHQLGGTIGHFVNDLDLIAKVSTPEEWVNAIQRIPFK